MANTGFTLIIVETFTSFLYFFWGHQITFLQFEMPVNFLLTSTVLDDCGPFDQAPHDTRAQSNYFQDHWLSTIEDLGSFEIGNAQTRILCLAQYNVRPVKISN